MRMRPPLIDEQAAEIGSLKAEIGSLKAEIERLQAIVELQSDDISRYMHALTPTADTKGEYSGEVYDWGCEDCGDSFVSWIAIKDIMKMIRVRVAKERKAAQAAADAAEGE